MAGLNIPGVTDRYKTSETVDKLMQIERIPLTREQNQLEEYKTQQNAWREINSQLSSLRETTRDLYSFDNPFNSKICTSSNEDAITAEATRSADIQSFKVDVIKTASSDRFMSDDLPSDFEVPKGLYTYKVSGKQVSFNWKGGSLKAFSDALNKRSNGVIKSMVIGATAGKKTLLIESLATGKENRLIFEGAAKDLAMNSGMITASKPSNNNSFSISQNSIQPVNFSNSEDESKSLPTLSTARTQLTNGKIHVDPRGAFQLSVPQNVASNSNNHITFTISSNKITDITEEMNKEPVEPVLPDSGFAEYSGIVVQNSPSESLYTNEIIEKEIVNPVTNKNILYAVMNDGSEKLISTPSILSEGEVSIDLPLSEYEGIKGILVKNSNTSYSFDVSSFAVYDYSTDTGYTPNHAVSEAGDAIIKYEGITITRPTNRIDDVVPEITLNLHDTTDRAATINIKPDKEASKNALINFVGKYNQVVAKINVLSQSKNEIIEELDYLSDDEKDKLRKQLGMFQTDFSLTSIKSNMQSIISASYKFDEYSTLSLLSQIGISTNATGYSGSYSASKLRGYLEIDEKKLDAALEKDMDSVKMLFGYDSDGDMIVDTGIAYKLDKQINAYTQSGGILALKTSTLDSKIKSSEKQIARLEDQMNAKEADLRQKYSSMEGSLNSLEAQQNSISNFTRQNSPRN